MKRISPNPPPVPPQMYAIVFREDFLAGISKKCMKNNIKIYTSSKS